jgi:hypothetical protein
MGNVKSSSTLTPTNQTKRKEVLIEEEPKYFLHLDADRDGKVDDNPQGLDKWEWGKGKKGAVILVNNNDSGSASKIDLEDDTVNGAKDINDLASLEIRRTGPAPTSEWKAILSIKKKDKARIRIFDSRTASGKEIIGPNTGIEYEFPDLAFDKKELGIEALSYPGKDFDGLISITLTLKKGKKEMSEHKAEVRVAPWIMFNHFNEPEKVFVMELPGENDDVVKKLTDATTKAGIPLEKVSSSAWRSDVWMQDIMEFGYNQLPGQPPMKTVLETPRGRELAGFPKTLLSDQLGYLIPIKSPAGFSSSLNSGGNLECTPSFTSPKGKHYPLGRMYCCKSRSDEPADSLANGYQEFLSAQKVQAPIFIDAGWLSVGHVDEIISFVPSSNSLGFKLLLASPKLGIEILNDAAKSGAKMLTGKNYIPGVKAEMAVSDFLSKGVDWKMSLTKTQEDQVIKSLDAATQALVIADPKLKPLYIEAFLAEYSVKMDSASILKYNESCQKKIDAAQAVFTKEMGLTSSDIAYVPIVYVHKVANMRAHALTAGMVNMLVLGKECIAPDPFGPVVGTDDLFKKSYEKTLKDCGLNINFADDWETYHVAQGEVHCGSNTLRKPDGTKKWWEFEP